MKLEHIENIKAFFETVDQCKGKVELLSDEGDRINLKSKLAQYLSLANVLTNGHLKEMDLVVHEKEDMDLLIDFMLNKNVPEEKRN